MLFGLLILSSFNACKDKKLHIGDYSFIVGNWNSAGTDSYENWISNGKGYSGVAMRIINNQLTKVDSMLLVEENGTVQMILHVAYSTKKKSVYTLVGNSVEVAYFLNDSTFPNQIAYRPKIGSNNLVVAAGANLQTKEKAFEFLYVPSSF